MTTLSALHSNLKSIISNHMDFKYSLLDFYLKSQYEKYISSIQAASGRKLCITGADTQTIKNQLKKIIFISDTVVFNTTDFNSKPSLDAFPFPHGLTSKLVRIMTTTERETGRETFIPNAAELISFIGLALADDKLKGIHDTILGYDVDNPQNNYEINHFYLSSTTQKARNGIEEPILIGLTETYSESLYNLIFDEAESLFSNGNLVFSPYIRTSSKDIHTLHNIQKAEALNTNLSTFDSKFHEDILEMSILENIDIPYIENISIETLSQIIKDEGESLASFRKQFHRAIEDIKDAKDNETLQKELKYIKRNLFEDELDKVEQLCNKVVRMKALSSVGAVVTTGIIGISAYFGLDVASTIMAGGGAGVATANELYKYYIDKQELRRNPLYIVWKLKSKK